MGGVPVGRMGAKDWMVSGSCVQRATLVTSWRRASRLPGIRGRGVARCP